MDRQHTAVTAGVNRALAATQQLMRDPTSDLDPAHPAASNQELRDQLRAVRTELNLLIADLRTTADSLDATVALITAARPADPARRQVVTRRQAKTLASLGAEATAARSAATALDDAVAQLDETINAVGDPSASPLPIETVTAAASVLYAVLDILRGGSGA
jgi:phage-related minor tail protein